MQIEPTLPYLQQLICCGLQLHWLVQYLMSYILYLINTSDGLIPPTPQAQAHSQAVLIQTQIPAVTVIRQPPEEHEGARLQSSATGAHVEDVPGMSGICGVDLCCCTFVVCHITRLCPSLQQSLPHSATPTETESHMSTDFNQVMESLETLSSELETSRGDVANDGVRQRTLH